MIRVSLRTKSVLTALLPLLTAVSIWTLGIHVPALNAGQLLAIVLTVSAAVGITAGLLAFRSTINRISRLIESAALVSAGVPIRSVESSRDELSQLAEAMSEMSRQVIEQQSAIRNVGGQLDAILRATTGVCILGEGLDGRITFCNPGAEKMLGYHQAALVGRSLLDTLHPAEEMKNRQTLVSALKAARHKAGSGAQELETVFIREDGLSIDVHLTITSVRDIKGQKVGVLYVASDVSARKVFEAELRFKNVHLKAQAGERLELAQKASDSLAHLNEAVLRPLLEIGELLKPVRDNLENNDALMAVNECRMLAESASDSLRQYTQTAFVPDSASAAPGLALPALVRSAGESRGSSRATEADIEDWYQAQGELPSRKQSTPRQSKILIVDDFEDTRALLRAYLKQSAYDLDFAADGYEALQKIAATRYAAVLMDIEMPVMNGHETALRIRNWENEQGLSPLPLIAISTDAVGDNSARLWTSCLVKPFTKGQLLAELDTQTVLS